MPAEKQKERANANSTYMPFAAFGLGFVAFIVQVITNDKMLSSRIFATGFWLVFAVGNFTTLYRGRI
jgi:hypothetical protein